MRWLATATLLRKHACALHIKMTDYCKSYIFLAFFGKKTYDDFKAFFPIVLKIHNEREDIMLISKKNIFCYILFVFISASLFSPSISFAERYLVEKMQDKNLEIIGKYGKVIYSTETTVELDTTDKNIKTLFNLGFTETYKLRENQSLQGMVEESITAEQTSGVRILAEAKPEIYALIAKVSEEKIFENIEAISPPSGGNSRVSFTSGSTSATQYIYSKFAEYGLSVEYQNFTLGSNGQYPYNTYQLRNIIATIPGDGTYNSIYVIGAHHDTCGNRDSGWDYDWQYMAAPGADDNATGIAVILELARILKSSPSFTSKYTIKFAAFAKEEPHPAAISGSHHGSEYYVSTLQSAGVNVAGAIILDMIGYNNYYDYVEVCSNSNSSRLADAIISANNTYSINLIPRKVLDSSVTYSDHNSFWLGGYQAILLMENDRPWYNETTYYIANPHYHRTTDLISTLNRDLVIKNAKTTLACLAELVTSNTIGTPTPIPTPSGTVIIVDDLDPEFEKHGFTSSSYEYTTIGASYLNHYYACYNELSTDAWWCKWTPVLAPGYYAIDVNIPSYNATTRNAEYKIYHSSGMDTVSIDQFSYVNSDWPRLGAYYFSGNGNEYVYLGDATGEPKSSTKIGFDAVRFVLLTTPTNTPIAQVSPTVTKTSTSNSTPISTNTPACILGDATCDNQVTPADALRVFSIFLGSYTPTGQEGCDVLCAADFNKDGNITPGDALCIFYQYLMMPC